MAMSWSEIYVSGLAVIGVKAFLWESRQFAGMIPTETRDPFMTEIRSPAHVADLIFENGKIYTVNAQLPWAEAVAVRNGRIVFVGSARGAREWQGPQTR